MDKTVEKEKSSRKTRDERERDRDRNRDYIKDHRRESDHHRDHERDRDQERERDHKHRTKDSQLRESEERHHSDKYREEKHSLKDNDSVKDKVSGSRHSKDLRHGDGDWVRSRDYAQDYESKREQSHELRDGREDNGGLKDRVLGSRHSKDDRHRDGDRHRSRDYLQDHESKHERSNEPRDGTEGSRDRVLHEESIERRSSTSHKRKEREESEEQLDKREKRVRDLDVAKEERREKRRFGDKVVDDSKDLNGIVNDASRERRKVEDGVEEEMRDVTGREERRVRRKFGDRLKEEGMMVVEEEMQPVSVINSEKNEAVDELVDNAQNTVSSNGSGSIGNGAALEPLNMASKVVPETSAPSQSPPIKVSSISTTNENKGVSVTRSHEVPGKSSTDGTTSAVGKSGSLSLDALAKAKRALQMQKELSEKLRKIPLLNKGASSDGSLQLGGSTNKKEPKALLSSAARDPGSIPPTTDTIASTSQAKSSITNAFTAATASVKPPITGATAVPGLTTIPNIEAVKRAQELAAKMGFHQDPEFAPLINMFPGHTATDVAVQQKPSKAPVLRLDALGREIDEHGNVINMPKLTNLSTLKVNINKQKKEAFQILKPELDVDPESNPHFDPGMGINKTKLLRPKRMNFQFVEEGKWSKDAEIIRFKSQFGEAQAKELKTKQAQLAKAKAEPDINPNLIEVSERVVNKEKPKDPIPETEWWDIPLLLSGNYGNLSEGSISEDKLKMDKITIYVEHPLPIEPPAEPAPPPPQPLKLTKKEQKKLRTQRRLAKEKDRQEMIRQGLLEPPKPKVKMSNLMKVLGSEATQDPTRLEMEIRSAAAEREQAHVDRNIARKLTPSERREKKERKLFEDPNTLETLVSVYRINDLSHPQTRFKVDVNAQENRLTGCAVISDGISVVAVEGGSKPIKRYGKLMLRRINWAASVGNEEDDDENEDKPDNKCVLVWQGSAAKPCFNRFLVHQCRTEAAARKVFSDAGVGHYWDLAINHTDE
ncbi:protein RDM16-like isoform X2 [Telopea speciosissima]|uniref:protein RDM16-like isoform X2 n=1 Tax=Telopea speciosissima TaxID=54955 RepID=UPI001CC40646|nr:protein RDM16-like isoform X2 [Telopea speciosissima]